jgi:hypothetical protein
MIGSLPITSPEIAGEPTASPCSGAAVYPDLWVDPGDDPRENEVAATDERSIPLDRCGPSMRPVSLPGRRLRPSRAWPIKSGSCTRTPVSVSPSTAATIDAVLCIDSIHHMYECEQVPLSGTGYCGRPMRP